ncbi:MAG TPA: tyrosine-type recombinase/integrase, partial [Spirochaetota bacterium]|nr:tyrosine-type recombinase/integrase [Spirochaetota bacterium]HQE60430.1 tyrosine-type recombinase/integrase [Spirochaetota bacterium]
PKQKKKLPPYLCYEEVEQILNSASNLKHKTILMLIYSSGLRVSEAINIIPSDILRSKMLLRINQGKGNKDRYTILAKKALEQLEKYWKAYKPKTYLFPGKGGGNQLSIRACQHAFESAKKSAGVNKKGGIHSLRHSFATHFLETGGGIFQLQKLLGHKQLRTTLQYAHLSEEKIIARSPLDVYSESNCK